MFIIGSAVFFRRSMVEVDDFDMSVIYLGMHMVFLIAAYISYTRLYRE